MSDSKWEWFPKEKIIRYQDAFLLLLLAGTFGAHQFYLGNKKRGYYLLITCGISHGLLLFSSKIISLIGQHLSVKATVYVFFSGYILGAPVWLWDLVTLYKQVKVRNGQCNNL